MYVFFVRLILLLISFNLVGIAVTHTVEENIENGVKFNAHVIEASPFYMAPEIIQGVKSSVPTAADIWSLACTIIELLESTPPY